MGLGYFLLPFVMGYSLGADPLGDAVEILAIGVGVCGIHALATAADYDADQAAGHRTFAVAFGRRAAAGFAAGDISRRTVRWRIFAAWRWKCFWLSGLRRRLWQRSCRAIA